jgi:hypothetical protein
MSIFDEIVAFDYERFAGIQILSSWEWIKTYNFKGIPPALFGRLIAIFTSHTGSYGKVVISLKNWVLKGYIVKLEYSGFYNGEKYAKIEP